MPWEVGEPEYSKAASETLNIAVDCTIGLDDGETISGAPTVTVSGLTISSVAVNAAAVEIDGKTVAIGKAVTMTIAGGTAGTTYEVKFFAATSAGQSRQIRNVFISVQAD